MNFFELFKDFEKATLENFPAEDCNTKHPLSEKHFYSNKQFLCLVIKPLKNKLERKLIICHPAVFTKDNGEDEFIWLTGEHKHIFLKNAYSIVDKKLLNADIEYVYAFVPYNFDFDEELYISEISDELNLNESVKIMEE